MFVVVGTATQLEYLIRLLGAARTGVRFDVTITQERRGGNPINVLLPEVKRRRSGEVSIESVVDGASRRKLHDERFRGSACG